jgi:hypothetical protein
MSCRPLQLLTGSPTFVVEGRGDVASQRIRVHQSARVSLGITRRDARNSDLAAAGATWTFDLGHNTPCLLAVHGGEHLKGYAPGASGATLKFCHQALTF